MSSDIANGLLVSAAAFLFGLTLIVAFRHLHVWRKYRAGLLPLHVGVIALSYDMLLMNTVIRAVQQAHRPWYAWALVGGGVVLGVWAMVVLLQHQGNYVSRDRS